MQMHIFAKKRLNLHFYAAYHHHHRASPLYMQLICKFNRMTQFQQYREHMRLQMEWNEYVYLRQ